MKERGSSYFALILFCISQGIICFVAATGDFETAAILSPLSTMLGFGALYSLIEERIP